MRFILQKGCYKPGPFQNWHGNCKICDKYGPLNVDHNKTRFVKLRDDFLNQNELTIDKIEIEKHGPYWHPI